MSEEQALLSAYADNPEDESLRLVLADWFEERGDLRGTWLRDRDLARWMGPAASDPIAPLIAALPDREEAKLLLLRIGPPAVPALLAAREQQGQGSHEQIDSLLTEMAFTVPGLPPLIKQLPSTDPRLQLSALRSLSELGKRAAPALPQILDLLKEDRDSIRDAVIDTLKCFGSLAGQALCAAWDQINWSGRWSADRSAADRLLEAVANLGPDSSAVRVLLEALGTSNLDIGESVVSILQGMGPALFDQMLLSRGYADSSTSWRISSVLRSYPDATARLLQAARDTGRESEARCCAIAALCHCDPEEGPPPEADALLPDLIALLDDVNADVLREVAEGLYPYRQRAAAAVPALVQMLDHPDRWLLYHVLTTLGRLGPAARVALPRVEPLLKHSDNLVRSAAESFVKQFADRSLTGDQVRQGLKSKKVGDRVRAIEQLADLVPDLPDVAELLGRALADRSKTVRQAVGRAFWSLRWAEIYPTPLLRQAIAVGEEEVRRVAVEVLARRPDRGFSLLPELLTLLKKEPSAAVRNAIVCRLHETPFRTPEVLAALRTTLRDPDISVRQATLSVLSQWQPVPAEILPDLLQRVQTDDTPTAGAVINLLLEQPEQPEGLVPLLQQRLQRYPQSWEHSAFRGLAKLVYTPVADDLPRLISGLGEDNTSFASSAAELLARLGPPALPALVRYLGAEFPAQARRCAAYGLGRMGRAAAPALPALQPLLAEDFDLRCAVIEAIGRIATPAEVVQILRPCLNDRHGRIRSDTLRILARLGADALPALPELLRLVRTEDDYSTAGELHKTLAALGAHQAEVVEQLRTGLREVEPLTRRNVLNTLALLGPRAAAARPDLEALLARAAKNERRFIQQVLERIQ